MDTTTATENAAIARNAASARRDRLAAERVGRLLSACYRITDPTAREIAYGLVDEWVGSAPALVKAAHLLAS